MLVAERLWKSYRPLGLPPLPTWVTTVFTFNVVTLAWIFFRSVQFGDAAAIVHRIVTWAPGEFVATPWTVGLIALGLACQFGPKHAIERLSLALSRLPFIGVAALGTLVLLIVEGLRGGGVAPFIYFQF